MAPTFLWVWGPKKGDIRMEIKFKKHFDEFKYLLMFDLASRNTGVCLWDINNNKPIETRALSVTGKEELPAVELLHVIQYYLKDLNLRHGIDIKRDVLVVKEAMPTQLRGGSSTMQTFIALARSHCVLDTLLYENGIATYDYVGIYPITWHNLFKKVANLGKDDKVTKEIVYDYIISHYKFDHQLTLDESDAVFLCYTFFAVKWNNDLAEQIKEVKRHRKTLKAPHAIKSCDVEISRLEGLKTLTK